MRAVRYAGPGKGVRLDRRVDEPMPPPGEARIRPIRVGICATDLEICRGYLNADSITLGHEFVGIVESVGEQAGRSGGAEKLVGRRVVGSINAVCGQCDMCRSGLGNHCRNRTVLGIQGRDGCFADAFCLPVKNLHVVPDEIDDDRAVFVEPLAAALHAAQQIHLEGKPYITILGDGRLGLLCAQVMNRLNASVRVLGRHASKLELCEKWGVKHRHVSEAGRRADQDVVVDCTGSPEGLQIAMQLVRPRGKILLKSTFAASADRKPVDLAPIVIHEIEVIGSRCGPFPEAIEMLRRSDVDVVSLITRRMKLDDAIDALAMASQPEQIKVLMDI